MHMFIRARAVVVAMVVANYLLSLGNVHCHRSSSADVICDVLEIRSLKIIHGQAFNWTTRKVFSALSHLCCQRKSHHMKIRGDGSLIDIYVSLSEPDTE